MNNPTASASRTALAILGKLRNVGDWIGFQ
jgi:hypothetical protein